MELTRLPGELRWCIFLSLLFFASASSPYPPISNGSGVITHLPGFQGPLPFHLQTGYVEVDSSNGVRLFYYFIRSERSPADDPLMLWLTGGPGCSVLTGLAYEIGPLSFDANGYVDGLPKLVYNQDSWTKVCNIIFLDSPVGAGFSYSNTWQGYMSSDTKAVNQILIFLKKVTSHLAGYLVGNPVTDSNFDDPSKIPFAHGMGIIPDEIYESYKESCSVGNNSHQIIQCIKSLNAIEEAHIFKLLSHSCFQA
nr:unnamed protein product [Digitaria exilis]